MSCSGSRATRSFLSTVRSLHPLDRSQSESVYHRALRRVRRENERNGRSLADPTVEQWHALVDRQVKILAMDMKLPPQEYERLAGFLKVARADPPPDGLTYAALTDLPAQAQKAVSAVRRQVTTAAAIRGVDPALAGERYVAFRDQYLREFSGLPPHERPDPPGGWVRGYTEKDMMAVSSPSDRATLYAMYRMQADPGAFGDAGRDARWASIDLETAGPEGKAGFEPRNGSIIEVAIIEYDQHGNEVGTWSTFVRPAPRVLAEHGTGAVDIHRITVEHVAAAPEWGQVAGDVSQRLSKRILLAQNAPYEREWLTHHLGAQRQSFDRWGPTADTLTIAAQHLPDLKNKKPATICAEVGVKYGDGHRARHDAEVTGRAFFALRRRMTREWLSDPVRASCPHPPEGAGRRTRGQAPAESETVSDCDFAPVTPGSDWTRAGTAA